jgi:hypothetical protein
MRNGLAMMAALVALVLLLTGPARAACAWVMWTEITQPFFGQGCQARHRASAWRFC